MLLAFEIVYTTTNNELHAKLFNPAVTIKKTNFIIIKHDNCENGIKKP